MTHKLIRGPIGNGPERATALAELRRCLDVLAMPGPAALATVPDGTVKADELALEYDDA